MKRKKMTAKERRKYFEDFCDMLRKFERERQKSRPKKKGR